jgi:2-(1,2-epoxy-1,2-dihydrophenyl)acetyl-CoA isomerase
VTGKHGPEPSVAGLVAALYPALMAGDRDRIAGLVADDFVGTVTESLPLGIGGVHHGREAMIDEVWWAFGKHFRLRVEPSELILCPDGRLLVLGRYVGEARKTGIAVDAAFVHLWTAENGRLTSVWHLTDSQYFVAALP